MFPRRACIPCAVFATIVLATDLAWAMDRGFTESNETKEQLQLKYDISVTDHGTGRVTVVVTIEDQGKLKPLDAVELWIPAREKDRDGHSYADLAVALATHDEHGKQVLRVHLARELAERAEIWFQTRHLDGKQGSLGGWFYSIPIATHLKDVAQEKK